MHFRERQPHNQSFPTKTCMHVHARQPHNQSFSYHDASTVTTIQGIIFLSQCIEETTTQSIGSIETFDAPL
eukprot:m.1671131 g.1671131  ORF g.1671131 m.1671131 type:complete len:71 (+) comp169474_c0_seq1:54-266(+)